MDTVSKIFFPYVVISIPTLRFRNPEKTASTITERKVEKPDTKSSPFLYDFSDHKHKIDATLITLKYINIGSSHSDISSNNPTI